MGIKASLRKRLNPRVYAGLGRLRASLAPSRQTLPGPTRGEVLAEIGEPFASALDSMYRGEEQRGYDGAHHALDSLTRITPEKGVCLYRLCREMKPQATMEVGCAYGFSTLFILAAHAANATGSHVAIDPGENLWWHGIGATKVRDVGMERAFHLIEEPSVVAVPKLMTEGSRFDLTFIDGNHRFDDVLTDFTLSALVCRPGGIIVLDDMWMPSVRKAVSFIRRNRTDFSEMPAPDEGVCVFRRTGEDGRNWDHFEDFE